MFLSKDLSDRIVSSSYRHLGRPFDYETFNCVHFVREVYFEVGINLPLLIRNGLPPAKFHLSNEEFAQMPIGHIVFFKRKNRNSERFWTHVAIIVEPKTLIHCTRNVSRGVVLTSLPDFMEVYELANKKP